MELEKAERERERLQSLLKTKATKGDNLAVLLPNLKERFETVITGLTTTRKHQHIDEAREALRTRLGRDHAPSLCGRGKELFDSGTVR